MSLKIDADYLCRELAALLAIPSPTGMTDEIIHHLSGRLGDLGLEATLTRRGAIRTRLAGRASEGARAVVGHVDTLGAQVKALREDGRLALVPVGHWSARFAEGARATVIAESGPIRGTILPPLASGHTFGEAVDSAPIGWDNVVLRLDVPVSDPAGLEALGVGIGDHVVIDPGTEFMPNGYIVSRHLDDKAGVAAMLAALRAIRDLGEVPALDCWWIFTIAEEVGHGAAGAMLPDIASLVAVDNGTTAPGQNSSEYGVTIAMADQTGPFDWHLTRKLVDLCRNHAIPHQKDVFRYYRSDSASALEAGADLRTALVTFGVDASHGYERIHLNALTSVAELLARYSLSPVEIPRDARALAGLTGFTHQPVAAPEDE